MTHDLGSRERQCPKYPCLNVLIQPHLSGAQRWAATLVPSYLCTNGETEPWQGLSLRSHSKLRGSLNLFPSDPPRSNCAVCLQIPGLEVLIGEAPRHCIAGGLGAGSALGGTCPGVLGSTEHRRQEGLSWKGR